MLQWMSWRRDRGQGRDLGFECKSSGRDLPHHTLFDTDRFVGESKLGL